MTRDGFSFPTRRSSDLDATPFPRSELTELIDHLARMRPRERARHLSLLGAKTIEALRARLAPRSSSDQAATGGARSEEHTSELQSRQYLVCLLLVQKKN